ncbi:MAG TPA: MFS transporter [Bryobacteraceae bacterium]|jgi:ACS family hexuronate transporter-like MFS transporter|nr:MFS transporter [Bryobacteraceae bacterium]
MNNTAALKQSATGIRGRIRWYVCGLLFYATTINYVDRQVLAILKPIISHELGWNEKQYGWIVFFFQLAYALMLPIAGRIIDKLGTRIGYAVAVLVWSCAAMSHALAHSVVQFAAARFALGIGEAANFPAAIKTTAAWFPRRERALATGIFNSGSNIGALVAPLLVPFIAAHYGWRFSFLTTGVLDIIWIFIWLFTYHSPRQHPRLSAEELALIESDGEEAQTTLDRGADSSAAQKARTIPYRLLLTRRAAWAFVIGKLLTDPVWWFYLYWLPGFLNQKYALDLTHLGAPLIAIYLAADVGSIGGGWLSSALLRRGFSVGRARKIALLTCAVLVVPVMGVMWAHGNLWLTVILIACAASGHQGWSCNLYTLVSDVFPQAAVGSLIGLGGMAGALGGMAVAPLIGYWLDFSHQAYGPLFLLAGIMYLFTLGLIQLLVPRLERVTVGAK